MPKVHLIGVGGIGMSALARWFLAQNWVVSGSDIASSEITQELAKESVEVKIGHKKANLDHKTGLVVYSRAVTSGNPELIRAREFGIPTKSYPEMVGELTRQYRTIAVSGSHGKSTTTSLLSLILIRAGLDPTVIVGTNLTELKNKNFRIGKSMYFVLEADEWRASFLNYSPTLLVILNIDREHLDFYKNISRIKKTYLELVGRIEDGGTLVLGDDKNIKNIQDKIKGIAKEKNLNVIWYKSNKMATDKIKSRIRLPGAYNIENALAAYAASQALGIPEKIVLQAVENYHGSWRRMEHKGEMPAKGQMSGLKCAVYDDYAHHPVEISATLGAFKEKYPASAGWRIICVFQPHQGRRLKALFRDFVKAFDQADYLILLPIYKVKGRDSIDKKFTSKTLTKAVEKRRKGPEVNYLANPEKLLNTIESLFTDHKSPVTNSVIVMMGAGDIVDFTPLLLS